VIIGVSLKAYLGYRATLRWCTDVAALLAGRAAAGQLSPARPELEFFVLPSFPLLVPALSVLAPVRARVGAQSVSPAAPGPHTGDVTAATLAELGAASAMTGHAERRRDHGETDEVVAAQLAATLAAGLDAVLCVGEPERWPAARAARFCRDQLAGALRQTPRDHLARGRVILAYEPVWAIGADQPAPDDHITAVCGELTAALRDTPLGSAAVIYGGTAGPGLLPRLFGPAQGVFLGRRAHDVTALAAALDDAQHCLT
jgi:triosephosphate isomerase